MLLNYKYYTNISSKKYYFFSQNRGVKTNSLLPDFAYDLFLTRKSETLNLRKISATQIVVTMTGLLGQLKFVRRFLSSENFDNMSLSNTKIRYNNFIFITSRMELGSF